MTSSDLLRTSGDWQAIDAPSAGWNFISFAVSVIGDGETLDIDADDREWAIVALSGTIKVDSGDGGAWRLGERASVFDGLGSCLYLPRDTRATVRADGGGGAEVALCGARSTRRLEPRLVTPDDVPIEIRGAGTATRQIGPLIPPDFPADRLHVVEVWTPGGNWSSYPPHKHDEEREGETVLEETYYYRFANPEGFAVQRLYSPERGVDRTWTVRDGDLLLIPFGYHTTAAAHGHDLYYLNVLAGPGGKRSLQAHEDPELAPVRETWGALPTDARVPLVPRRAAAGTDATGTATDRRDSE